MKRQTKMRGSVKIVYKKGRVMHFYINGTDISNIVQEFIIINSPITRTSALFFSIPIVLIDLTVESQ